MKFFTNSRKAINTSWWIDNAIVAILYFVICALVLQLPQSLLGAPIFPSAGIAIGALLARGRSPCFGVFLGAVLNSLWSAFRFGSKITTILVTTTAMVTAISTVYKIGIFYKVSQEANSLSLLQLFMGVISITAIAILALVTENERSAHELKEQVLLKNQAYIQVDRINKD